MQHKGTLPVHTHLIRQNENKGFCFLCETGSKAHVPHLFLASSLRMTTVRIMAGSALQAAVVKVTVTSKVWNRKYEKVCGQLQYDLTLKGEIIFIYLFIYVFYLFMFFFLCIMQKFSSEFLGLKHGLSFSDAWYSQQTTIFQYAIVICISNGCAEVLKRAPFSFSSAHIIIHKRHSAHSSMCCRIRDHLFHIPTHLRFPSELFWLAGICELYRQIK